MAKIDPISADFLRQLFHYDPVLGELRWKERAPETFLRGKRPLNVISRKFNTEFAGKKAGTLRNGYRRVKINGRYYTATHIIWTMMTGKWPKDQIDHRDGKRGRNSFQNLREASNAQNCQNRKKRRSNQSGATGVSRRGTRWLAEISGENGRIYLGAFSSKRAARIAYLKAKVDHHSFQPTPRRGM